MVKFKRVVEKEFYNFLKNYKRPLDRDCYAVCEPPSITYNDFSLGKWPDSVVAKTCLYDDDEDGYYYTPKEDRYYAVAELDEDGNPIIEKEKEEDDPRLIIVIHPDGTITRNFGVVELSDSTWGSDDSLNKMKK